MQPSTRNLLLANLITIFLALWQHWNLQIIMLSYWIQSIIIGWFQFRKLLDLKTKPDPSLAIIPIKPLTTYASAIFFLIHYGSFHLIYLMIIHQLPQINPSFSVNIALDGHRFPNSYYSYPTSSSAAAGLLLSSLTFFTNHLFSYRLNRKSDTQRHVSVGELMFLPYLRIVPMHLTILFGLTFGLPEIIFLSLKTIADLLTHQIEHFSGKWRQAAKTPPQKNVVVHIDPNHFTPIDSIKLTFQILKHGHRKKYIIKKLPQKPTTKP